MKKWRDRRKQVTVVSNSYRDISSSDENIEVNDSTSMNVDADSPSENGMFVNNENTCNDVDSDLGLDLDDSVGPDLGAGVGPGSGPGSSDSSSESGLDASSSESDSDCLNDENDDDALCERLKTWALNNNCTRDCIDDLPIFKSSSINPWSILIRFHPFKPISVAFYCGKSQSPHLMS